MPVSSGWVGSSAVSNTGDRWMSAAGGKLRLPTPFWMSQMVGRSRFNYQVRIGHWRTEMRGDAFGYAYGQAGSISPNSLMGYTVLLFGPGEYMHQLIVSVNNHAINGRRARVSVEGLGTWEGTFSSARLQFHVPECWRWFRDRNNQTINVLMEAI